MAVNPIKIDPTFPLDEARIATLVRETTVGSIRLRTLRFLGWIGSGLAHLSWPQLKGLGRSLTRRWSEAERDVMFHVIRQLIRESNHRQDETIRQMIDDLQLHRKGQYAIALGKFLLLKQHIERELHRKGELTNQKQKIEILVDSICHEVCREIHQVSLLEGQLAEALTSRNSERLSKLTETTNYGHASIMHAYATLAETAEQLQALLQPGKPQPDNVEARSLDRLLHILREENELAKIVDERIRKELPQME